MVIIAGRVNASARKITSGCSVRTSRISHSQNAAGFVCGLSTRNTVTPRSTQPSDDVEQRLPEPAPVLGLEVDVVDVLVFLGRVLRVLERPVRAAVEPLGMLLQPRVIRRALDREVERDLDPRRPRRGDQRVEVLPRAEVRVQRVVAALLRADRPRRADVAFGVLDRVVLALPVRVADRVDRRQVHDVEAELRELRQHSPRRR